MRLINEECLAPLCVNHLLTGRNRDAPPPEMEFNDDCDNYALQHLYVSDLEKTFWRRWKDQALSTLMPFHAAKHVRESPNLAVGDVVYLLMDNKVSSSYRLARVVEAKPSPTDGVVRVVKLQFLKKNILKKAKAYTQKDFENREYAVQNLVLVVTNEEVETRFWRHGIDDIHLDTVLPEYRKILDGEPSTAQ